MNVFIDTSGFYSLLAANDKAHTDGKDIWLKLLDQEANLITSNYVVTEATALVQNRLGMEAVTDLHEHVFSLVEVYWVVLAIHHSGVSAMLTANRRQLSLVDCVSFEVCRELGIKDAFAFDKHFEEQGFNLLVA